MYEETAGSGDDGEKVQLLRKLDNSSRKNTSNDRINNGYDEEMGRKFKVVGGSDDNTDYASSP